MRRTSILAIGLLLAAAPGAVAASSTATSQTNSPLEFNAPASFAVRTATPTPVTKQEAAKQEVAKQEVAKQATAKPASGPAVPKPVPSNAPASLVLTSPGQSGGLASTQVPATTLVAAAKQRKTSVYAKQTDKLPFKTFDNAVNFSGRHVFVVIGQEGTWYKVQLPSRPNGVTAWVKASDVTVYRHDYAIQVSLSQHKLTLYKGGLPVLTDTVAVGSSKYPTPTGTYFVRELAKPSNPRGAYGPYAFGLSAYSNVLQTFGRGDGQIGIHGTNQPKQLGMSVSHGCIRMNNTTITKLAKMLPQGVPVTILA